MMRHSVAEVVTKQQKYDTLKPRYLKRYTGYEERRRNALRHNKVTKHNGRREHTK